MPTNDSIRPPDATLSVTKAARLLGVHPNTIRAWSDAGRLRYYRINPRGDRRYRLGDLQRFLSAAEQGAVAGFPDRRRRDVARTSRHRPDSTPRFAPLAEQQHRDTAADPLEAERHHLDLTIASSISRLIDGNGEPDEALRAAVHGIRDAYGHHLVVDLGDSAAERLDPRAVAGADQGGSPA